MKPIVILFVTSCAMFAAETPPRTVMPRSEMPYRKYLQRVWSNPGSGCDIVKYHLFDYTDRHPERVKFTGDDDVIAVDGFVDYLATKSPIIVKDDDGHIVTCLIFFNGGLYTPWGQEIVFLMNRTRDGYLRAFGHKTSVNSYADPWQQKGFSYAKAVGITLKTQPEFMDHPNSIITLNDNDFQRIGRLMLEPRVREIRVLPE